MILDLQPVPEWETFTSRINCPPLFLAPCPLSLVPCPLSLVPVPKALGAFGEIKPNEIDMKPRAMLGCFQ